MISISDNCAFFEFTVEIAPLPQRKGYSRPTPFIDSNIKNIKAKS